MQFQVLYFTFICYQLILIKEFVPKMKYLCFDLMFLSKINQVILVAILLFFWFKQFWFKASVRNDLFCDILLSWIPFWSDYVCSRWILFSNKQIYNQANWDYMAKSRCQHNILQIFWEIVTFSSFICLKTWVFFSVTVLRLLPSFIYFLFIDSKNILRFLSKFTV